MVNFKAFFIVLASYIVITFAITPPATAADISISAVDLVQLARNGYLQEQGIPQFNQLAFAYRSGELSAEDVINAAITANRLSRDVADDPGYLETVDHFLNDLDR